jgi:hypothetical protein
MTVCRYTHNIVADFDLSDSHLLSLINFSTLLTPKSLHTHFSPTPAHSVDVSSSPQPAKCYVSVFSLQTVSVAEAALTIPLLTISSSTSRYIMITNHRLRSDKYSRFPASRIMLSMNFEHHQLTRSVMLNSFSCHC